MNLLREVEIAELTQMVREQQQLLQRWEELLLQRLESSPTSESQDQYKSD